MPVTYPVSDPASVGRPAAAHPAGAAPLARLITHLFLARLAARQRRALARLDAAALDDIGVSRDEALAEVRRRAWDVPPSWLR